MRGIPEGWRGWVVLGLPALVVVVLSLQFWQGMRGTDDLGYAQVAMSYLQGGPSPPMFYRPDFHDARLGTIAPLAAVFAVFGPSDLSMALLPLVCTMLTAVLVAWLGRRFWGDACGLTAGLLYALLPLTIAQATFYVPEPIATFEMCVAVVLVLLALERQRQAGALLFVAGVLVGIAYLTTEVGALMLPALYLYLWVTEKGRRRDAWLLAGFVLVLGLELTYHAAVHGNPLYRFTLSQGYGNDALVQAANRDVTYRLFKEYPALFVYPGLDFGVTGVLMVLGGLYGLVRWRTGSLFVIWAAIILLFYNFMSGSLTQYLLIPVAARHVAPTVVPLCILAAKLAVDAWGWAAGSGHVAIRVGARACCAAAALGIAGCSLIIMYVNTAPTLTAAIARNAKSVAGFLGRQSSVTVVSDRMTARDIQFYRQYRPADRFLTYDSASRMDSTGVGSDGGKSSFLVINGPVVNEKQVSGAEYGGNLSLSAVDRVALGSWNPTRRLVFSARLPPMALLTRLFRYGPVRYAVGPYTVALERKLLVEDPALGEVTVSRLAPAEP